MASETAKNRGGVAFFISERRADERQLDWWIEDMEVYDTNIIACTLVTGTMQQRLVGAYLSPSKISGATWHGLHQACDEAKDPVWLLGDFNCNPHNTDDTRLDAALGPNPTRSAKV